jgi:hypothetical protein
VGQYPATMDTNQQLRIYLLARHARAFRRLLWARLAVGLLVWVIVALAISLSRAALIVGIAMTAVPAAWALWYEWRATRDLYSQEH